MNTTVPAVFENGKLRPEVPLQLKEGEKVQVTIRSLARSEADANEDLTQLLKSATTIHEWIEATKQLPGDDGGYDIVNALNENRIWSGTRPLLPSE